MHFEIWAGKRKWPKWRYRGGWGVCCAEKRGSWHVGSRGRRLTGKDKHHLSEGGWEKYGQQTRLSGPVRGEGRTCSTGEAQPRSRPREPPRSDGFKKSCGSGRIMKVGCIILGETMWQRPEKKPSWPSESILWRLCRRATKGVHDGVKQPKSGFSHLKVAERVSFQIGLSFSHFNWVGLGRGQTGSEGRVNNGTRRDWGHQQLTMSWDETLLARPPKKDCPTCLRYKIRQNDDANSLEKTRPCLEGKSSTTKRDKENPNQTEERGRTSIRTGSEGKTKE